MNITYKERVKNQIAQYASAEIHDLPPIYDYWSNTYLRPKLNSVLGVDTVTDFYVEHIHERETLVSQPIVRLLSLGAGDAELEVQIAQGLLAKGLSTFQLECLELSPILIERANQRIHQAGLGEHVTMLPSDLNSWSLPESSRNSYTAVIANHILHHVVELEGLFAKVALAVGDTGVFLTADMIGRNGHMRWPEAIAILNPLWDTLPDVLKYNHVFRKTDRVFNNWDCSSNGFEGIRAQDILPLLVQRFHFEKFLAFGNLPDPFCDRCYGPNFQPDVPAHTGFIDSLERLNSQLLELGLLKPTMMFAVIRGRDTGVTRVWRNLTPRFCVRDPGSLELSPEKSEALERACKPTTIGFRSDDSGQRLLRSGWSFGEEWGTWMTKDEAVIELLLPPLFAHDRLHLRLTAMAFVPKRLYSRSFTFRLGDVVIGDVTFKRTDREPKKIDLEVPSPNGDSCLLRVIAHETASPAEDGCDDDRFLALALIDLVVY